MNKYMLMLSILDVINDVMLKKADGEYTMEEFYDTFDRTMKHLSITFNKGDLFAFESKTSGDLWIRIGEDLKNTLGGVFGIKK